MIIRKPLLWLTAAILLAAVGYFLLVVLANYGVGFVL